MASRNEIHELMISEQSKFKERFFVMFTNTFFNKYVLTGIFFAFTTLFFTYLFSMRFHTYLPYSVFWVSIISMVLILLFQIMTTANEGYEKILVLEILIYSISLHLLYQIPYYGLFDSDSYEYVMVSKQIIKHGVILPVRIGENDVPSWPATSIFGASLNLMLGITLLSVAKWFPSFFAGIFISIFYLFVRKIFEKKTALLSVMVYSSLYYFTGKGSTFVGQIFALVPLTCVLFLLLDKENNNNTNKNKVNRILISILCLGTLSFSHHVTGFILALICFIHFATSTGLKFLERRKGLFLKKPILNVSLTFVFLTSIAFISYSIYVNGLALAKLVSFMKFILFPEKAGLGTFSDVYNISASKIFTLRGMILYYGFYLFNIIFGLVILYNILFQYKKHRPEFFSFSFFLLVNGVFGLVQLYILPVKQTGLDPERILLLGWILGSCAVVHCLINNRKKFYYYVGILLLTLFIVYNLYSINFGVWDPKYEDIPGNVLIENYALAKTINFSPNVAATKNDILALYDVQGFYAKNMITQTLKDIKDLDYIIINKIRIENDIKDAQKNRYPHDKNVLYQYVHLMNKGTNKIFDSNKLMVIKLLH